EALAGPSQALSERPNQAIGRSPPGPPTTKAAIRAIGPSSEGGGDRPGARGRSPRQNNARSAEALAGPRQALSVRPNQAIGRSPPGSLRRRPPFVRSGLRRRAAAIDRGRGG